jgi:hypothetical protein
MMGIAPYDGLAAKLISVHDEMPQKFQIVGAGMSR